MDDVEPDNDPDLVRLREAYDDTRRRKRDRLLRVALDLGVVLYQDPTCPQYHTFTFTPPDPTWPLVHVSAMIFNWRLSEYDGIAFYGRHWCFEGRGESAFIRAVQQLAVWQANPDTEPVGWLKAYDGRGPGDGYRRASKAAGVTVRS